MIYYKGSNFDLRVEENDEYTNDFIEILNSVENNKNSQLCRLPLTEPKKNDEHNLIFAITTDIGNKPKVIGRISLENINYINQSAEFKIFIRSDCQKKGIGMGAGLQLIEHGFKALNLQRIYCGTLETNNAFKTLAMNLGFKSEGIRRFAVWNEGKFIDSIEYGLLRSEYYAESNGKKVESPSKEKGVK